MFPGKLLYAGLLPLPPLSGSSIRLVEELVFSRISGNVWCRTCVICMVFSMLVRWQAFEKAVASMKKVITLI